MGILTELFTHYEETPDGGHLDCSDGLVVNTDRSAPFDPLGGVMWLEGIDEPVTGGPDEDGTTPAEAGGGTEPPAGEAV